MFLFVIAATAQVHQLILVTRNLRDFWGCGVQEVNPFETVNGYLPDFPIIFTRQVL